MENEYKELNGATELIKNKKSISVDDSKLKEVNEYD